MIAWATLFGAALGLVLGGPLGAIAGAMLGYAAGRRLPLAFPGEPRGAASRESARDAFLAALFTVMGRVAKADGRVSTAEIAQANRTMDRLGLPPSMRHDARRLFTEGKSPTYPLEQVIEQFADACRHRRDLARLFVEIQIQAACSDGAMSPAERAIIERVAARLGITGSELAQLESLVRAAGGPDPGSGRPTQDAAHAALGVTRNSSDDEVKRAYRRLMSQHHPDKLVAQGLPEEMVRMATRRTQEIQAAYEAVRASRKR